MKENVSGCFFLNTVYRQTVRRWTQLHSSCLSDPLLSCLHPSVNNDTSRDTSTCLSVCLTQLPSAQLNRRHQTDHGMTSVWQVNYATFSSKTGNESDEFVCPRKSKTELWIFIRWRIYFVEVVACERAVLQYEPAFRETCTQTNCQYKFRWVKTLKTSRGMHVHFSQPTRTAAWGPMLELSWQWISDSFTISRRRLVDLKNIMKVHSLAR